MIVPTSLAEIVDRTDPPDLEGRLDRQPPVLADRWPQPDDGAGLNRSELAVLLIEDNAYDIEIIRKMLDNVSAIQFRLEHADRLAAGLDLLARTDIKIDVVLVDLGLPDSQGLDTFECVRAQAPHVAIVLLSGLSDREVAIQAVRMGAQDYLVKGQVDTDRLQRSLRYAFERNRVQQSLAERNAQLAASRRQIQHLNADLEKRVAQRTKQLATAVGELETFCYSISHDLRAPLRHIDGFSRALLEDHADQWEPQATTYLRWIRDGAQHMGELIDAMLQLCRTSHRPLQPVPVDLSGLARRVAADLRRGAPDRNVRLRIAPGLGALGDADLLGAVVGNLLGNAWKFTSSQDPAEIEFGGTSCLGVVTCFVRDNGVGFDAAAADRLFKPFQRLHAETEFDGTGIGLATVERIVHRHGGTVWAEAIVGKGATFFFTLPADESATVSDEGALP